MMNGSLLYGPMGRVQATISYVVLIIAAMQVGGLFQFLPPKVTAIIIAAGATLTVLSERLQGGASKPDVRSAAEQADKQNAIDELNR